MCYHGVDYSNLHGGDWVIGIDVGKKGAYAILDYGTEQVIKTGTFKTYNHKRLFRVDEFYKTLSTYRDKIIIAGVEFLHAFPSDSRRTSFVFGMQLGAVLGCLELLSIPIIEISPTKWKYAIFGKENKDTWKKNKEYSVQYVKERYPKTNLYRTKRCKKPDNNIADAVCIALATIKQLKGERVNGKK